MKCPTSQELMEKFGTISTEAQYEQLLNYISENGFARRLWGRDYGHWSTAAGDWVKSELDGEE